MPLKENLDRNKIRLTYYSYNYLALDIYNEINIRDHTNIKVVQATHHQGDNRYGSKRGMQSSWVFFVSVSWALFKFPGLWEKVDLDSISGKGESY